jgi:hypothetical protein
MLLSYHRGLLKVSSLSEWNRESFPTSSTSAIVFILCFSATSKQALRGKYY